jgi:predicted transcriptional regulator
MTISELQQRVEQLEGENSALREKLDYAEAVAGIKRGLEQVNKGQMKPLRQVDEELRAKYKIARA